jgi:hypothetical protein
MKLDSDMFNLLVEYLVQNGMPVPKNGLTVTVLSSRKYERMNPQQLYELVKSLVGDKLKNMKYHSMRKLAQATDGAMLFLNNHHVEKYLMFSLPFIRYRLTIDAKYDDLSDWLSSIIFTIKSIKVESDVTDVTNLSLYIIKYIVSSVNENESLYTLILETIRSSMLSLYDEPYFKNLLRRSLNYHKLCNVCYEPAKTFCSKCKSIRYCEPECQREDWTDHKLICKVDFIEPKIDTPECPAVEEILILINKIEEKYKDDTWRPFD